MGDSRNKTLKNSMVDVKTAELAQAVADSEEYKSYLHYLEEIKKQPELYEKVCDYRRRNFELQNMDVADNMFDEVMRFQMENAGIRKNELVNEFLKAELSVCRMLQGITRVIADSVELDTDFL
ncbi:putative uncharacterized protein [Firmicutes bacterium CAG:882]|nr:putative uncharacterized protein [Firmicutes bacterium CAG:882]